MRTMRSVKKFLVMLGLCGVFTFLASAANVPDFLWAKQGGVTDSAVASRVAVDLSGNVFVTGYFRGRLGLGETNLVSERWITNDCGLPPFVSVSDDIFVIKYDANGRVVWARSAGGLYNDYAAGMAVDLAGNCYVTGSFQINADFGGITLTNTMTPNTHGLFLAKYNPQGGLLWLKQANGDLVQGLAIGVEPGGNLFVTGDFIRTASFNGINISSPTNHNIFVAKYDSNGIPLWVRQGGTDSFGTGYDVAADQLGNCYVTGVYNTRVTFGGSTLTASPDAHGIFLVSYGSDGTFRWARQGAGPRSPGGSVSDSGSGVGVDRFGDIYLSGMFGGITTFEHVTLTNIGSTDIFLAKYDAQGDLIWICQAGGVADDVTYRSAVSSAGDVYLTGYYRSQDFYSDSESFATQGDFTMFLAKYDARGHLRGFVRAGGGEFQQGVSAAVDSFGSSYFAGRIGRSIALFGTNALSSGIGSSTFYVTKLSPFDPVLNISRQSDSTTLSWPSWATNWQLESSGLVSAPASWSSVMEKPFLVGGENVLTNADTASRSFFRLRRP